MSRPIELRAAAVALLAAAALSATIHAAVDLLWPTLGDWEAPALSAGLIGLTAALAAVRVARRERRLAAALAAETASRQEADARRRAGERFADALMEHSSDLISVLNPDGTVRFASPSHLRVLGYAPGELVGTNAFDLVHPDDQQALREAFVAGIGVSGPTVSREFRMRHKDGSWRVMESAARTALTDPVIAGAVINSRDVTELRAAQREEVAVAAALARIGRELIAQLDRPVLLDRLCRLTTEVLGCDASRTYLLAGDGAAFAPVASHGDAPDRWNAFRGQPVTRAAVDRYFGTLADADVAEVDLRALAPWEPAPGGGTRAPRVLAMALRRAGDLIGIHAAHYADRAEPCTATQVRIARGLAQLASLALENARLVAELDRADRIKSDFVASMSHELRTPLNVIIGYADLLGDQMFGELGPEQQETVRRIGEQGRELLELVNTTLDLSRLEPRRVGVAFQEVDLVNLLAEIELEAHLVRKNPTLDLSWRVAPELPALWTDPTKLKIVVKNLLFNAIKFTDEGGVVVRAEAQDGGVEIAVEDSGIGIAADVVPFIFDAFRQADTGARSRGGVGLGLHIVRRLVDILGGTIAVESEPDRGSTFRVWVPLGTAERNFGDVSRRVPSPAGRGSG